MSVGRSLRASLASITPTWLQNAPGFRNIYQTLWVICLLGDCLREVAVEGRLAAYPGVGTPTALGVIAQSRGLLQGADEPDANFAARCIAWLTTWTQAGSAAGLAQQIQAYLVGAGSLGSGVYPVVRVVDRAGNAVTANADRSITFSQVSWNWDELGGWDSDRVYSATTVTGFWSDLWVVIQDPYTHWTSFSDPVWLAAWESGEQTLDSQTPQATVTGIYSLIDLWKGAHCFVRNVTWVPDPTSFSPSGYFGDASRVIAGEQKSSRTPAYSYWEPIQGG